MKLSMFPLVRHTSPKKYALVEGGPVKRHVNKLTSQGPLRASRDPTSGPLDPKQLLSTKGIEARTCTNNVGLGVDLSSVERAASVAAATRRFSPCHN